MLGACLSDPQLAGYAETHGYPEAAKHACLARLFFGHGTGLERVGSGLLSWLTLTMALGWLQLLFFGGPGDQFRNGSVDVDGPMTLSPPFANEIGLCEALSYSPADSFLFEAPIWG